MDDWERRQQEDRARNERSRRERREDKIRRERDRKQDRRHNEKIALENKRDRVESMRNEGYSETEIRSAERKRGCIPVLVIAGIIAVGLAYVLGTQAGKNALPAGTEINSDQDYTSDEQIAEAPQVDAAIENDAAFTDPETALLEEGATTRESQESAPDITFKSEEVVQQLPEQSETNEVPQSETEAIGNKVVKSPSIKSGSLSMRDFPNRLASQDTAQGGEVLVVFNVTASGRASNCRVRETTVDSDTTAAVCPLVVEQMRFNPAIDGEGNAVEAMYGYKQEFFKGRR